jgi:hypothetical protein
MRVPGFVVGLVTFFWATTANAQLTPECQNFWRVMAAQSEDKANLDAWRTLTSLIPEACPGVRTQFQPIITRLEAAPEWVMVGDDGAARAVEPPPAPAWAADVELWPSAVNPIEMLIVPTQAQIDRLHPPRARDRSKVGSVTLEGRIREDGTLVWRVAHVFPSGWGFEAAALRAGALYRAPLTFPDGRTTIGTTFYTVIGFTLPPRVIIQQ